MPCLQWRLGGVVRVFVTLFLINPILPAYAVQGSGPSNYIYDQANRLIGIVDSAGHGVVYTYDAAGNITSITPSMASQVSIIGFTPGAGPAGATVTISGTGFSTTPLQNTVAFNQSPATVTSSTSTQIVATVPAGATTGQISISTPNGSVTSASVFTVYLGPTITSFAPAIGVAGAAVTIQGSGYLTAPGNNQVAFNEQPAIVNSATENSIAATVPASATSGKVSVATPYGNAVSVEDFFVPPAPYVHADIQVTDRMAVGQVKLVSIVTAGKKGLILFDGTSGQQISMVLNPVTISSGTVSIRNPDGTILASTSISTSGAFIDARTLPSTGTYTIFISPSTASSGNVTITLHDVEEVTGQIVAGGAAVTVTTSVPGQNASLTFEGTAGQRVSMRPSGVTLSHSSSVTILRPDGTTLASDSVSNFIDAKILPVTGTYKIVINPYERSTGKVTQQLYDVPADATAAIAVSGPAITVTTTVPGQNARLTFDGIEGQRITLVPSGVTLSASSTVAILNPDGSILASGNVNDFFDVKTLPASGTYTITVNPYTSSTGKVALQLYEVPADVVAAITAGGPAVTVTTTVPGQNVRLMFEGTAGQLISMLPTGVTLAASSTITILKPDGSILASGNVNDFFDARTLAATGTYTITVNPYKSSTGTVTLQLYEVPSDAGGTIVVGGPSVAVTITVPGQNGLLSFDGTAGQHIILRPSGVTLSPSSVITIRKPDGSNLVSATVNNLIDMTSLPATGTYTISINPYNSSTGNMTLQLTL